jgi:hypothetical protein
LIAPFLLAAASRAQLPPAAAPDPPPPAAAPASPTTEPLPPGFDAVALGLELSPRRFDSLGFQMHLPAGAAAVPERSSAGPSILIEDRPGSATWSLRVQAAQSPLVAPTPAAQVQDHLRRLRDSGTAFRLLQDRAATYRGAPGHWCLIEQESPDRRTFVKGWLFVQTDPDRFLVFSMLTLPEHLEAARKRIEASLSTLDVTSQRELTRIRQAMLELGGIHLSTLTEERLRSLVGLQRLLRLHRPQRDEEIGYHLLQVTEGPRGALDPERPERMYQAPERVQGLLVKLQGRLAVDPAADHYLDWIGLYWLAWDLSSEAWSVRATHRRSGSETGEVETGLRNRPDPRPRLTVIRSRSRAARRTPFEWALPEVYLPQALTLVLGALPPPLVEGGEVAVAFYAYDGSDERPAVSLRLDRWRDLGSGWEHSHMSVNDVTPTVALYGADGALLESREPDGVVTSPIEPAALERLWKTRGLRMGSERR